MEAPNLFAIMKHDPVMANMVKYFTLSERLSFAGVCIATRRCMRKIYTEKVVCRFMLAAFIQFNYRVNLPPMQYSIDIEYYYLDWLHVRHEAARFLMWMIDKFRTFTTAPHMIVTDYQSTGDHHANYFSECSTLDTIVTSLNFEESCTNMILENFDHQYTNLGYTCWFREPDDHHTARFEINPTMASDEQYAVSPSDDDLSNYANLVRTFFKNNEYNKFVFNGNIRVFKVL